MRSIICLLSAQLVFSAPQFTNNNSGPGCTCNGRLNSKGEGECRSEYQGRAFCYVDPGRCSDQLASSIEGQWWSHNACQTSISSQSSEFSPTKESRVNFGQKVEEKKGESQRKCICNGLKNSRGEGECKSSYKGKAFCYVDRGSCSDELKSTSSNLWWSYQACSSQEKFFSQAPTSNVIGGIIEKKLKLIGGATNAILSVPVAIGGIITSVLTQGSTDTETIDKQEGEMDCWCETDQATFVNERRATVSNIQTRIVNRPICRDGEVKVCSRQEEEEEVDTAPLIKEEKLVCSCNGQLNNERLGVLACESSFRGAAWCYVQAGLCRDEITSDTTGKTWSQDACGLDLERNKGTHGVLPIAPRLQLQLE